MHSAKQPDVVGGRRTPAGSRREGVIELDTGRGAADAARIERPLTAPTVSAQTSRFTFAVNVSDFAGRAIFLGLFTTPFRLACSFNTRSMAVSSTAAVLPPGTVWESASRVACSLARNSSDTVMCSRDSLPVSGSHESCGSDVVTAGEVKTSRCGAAVAG